MEMIRDYKDTYKKLGSKEFIMFYLGEYNMLRHEVYNKWKVPGIMLLLLVIDRFIDFEGLYMMAESCIWILLGVGIISTCLVLNDKWYGAVLYAGLLAIYLVTGVGYIYDKAMWVVGIIAAFRTIVDIKEIDNLKVYYDMAKLTEQEKGVESTDEKIWME